MDSKQAEKQGESLGRNSATEGRRRAPPYVTKNACVECRKRKSKCDGKQPCARCIAHGIRHCQYEVSIRVSKEELRSEIESLRNYRRLSEHVLSHLSSGTQSELIIRQLSAGKGLKTISESLEPDDSFSWDPEGSSPTSPDEFADSSRGELSDAQRTSLEAGVVADEEETESIDVHREWTSVITDPALIESLMALYFCWEYPAFAGFVKKHFLTDFKAGRNRYCSSLLVNAILALGAALSDHLENHNNGEAVGMRLFEEAEKTWVLEENEPSLTTIQALCLMSLREASWGHEQQSWFYSGQAIRLAVEMGLSVQSHSEGMSVEEEEVRAATFWGASTIDQTLSLGLGRLPQVSRKGMRVRKPILVGMDEEDEWTPYSDGDQTLPVDSTQPCHTRSVYRNFCELARIMHSTSYGLFQPGKGITSQDLVDMYVQYLDWYNALPAALRLGQNSTPVVLFVHMHYHFAVIQLFRPFIKLRLIASGIVPREICIQAANAIASLIHAYRQLYGLRRTPSFMPYIVLTATIIHIIDDHAHGRDMLSTQTQQDILNLEDLAVSYQFARTASTVLRVVMHSWNNALAVAAKAELSEKPKAMLMPMVTSICPGEEDLIAIRYNYQISEYPLFSIFPGQGLPFLSGGDDPKSSGFELKR